MRTQSECAIGGRDKKSGRREAGLWEYPYLCSRKPFFMNHTALLAPETDPMGAAVSDYYANGRASRLRVFSTLFDEDELPVETLFRTWDAMPGIERKALAACRGRVLDVGAGAGCHSLVLQERGFEVTAVDVSPLLVDVMRRRGVRDVRHADVFDPSFVDAYDTVLMLMNGSGIIGRIERMPEFFRRMKLLLRPGGCIIMDSSDLRYVFEDEDGVLDIDLNAGYYGEVDFRMKYKSVEGPSFDWLYVDFDTLAYHASENGFTAERLAQGGHYDYLAVLKPRK